MRSRNNWRAWEIILLVLGSPLWVPLLLSAFVLLLSAAIVALSVYIVIWSAIIALYAADLTLAAGAISGIVGGICLLITQNHIQALYFFGVGCVCAGATVLLFLGLNKITLVWLRLNKYILGRIPAWIRRKRVA